jgi:hypothetical protein
MTESREFREQLGLKCVPQFDNAGPVFKSAKIIDKAIIEVKFHNVVSGLLLNEGSSAFEIAGEDGVFQKAQNLSLSIDKESIFIRRPDRIISDMKAHRTSPDHSPIKYIRYGKNKQLKPNLFNVDGFPAEPFEWSAPDSVDTKSQKEKS